MLCRLASAVNAQKQDIGSLGDDAERRARMCQAEAVAMDSLMKLIDRIEEAMREILPEDILDDIREDII